MSEQANSSQVGNASATLDGKNQPSWNDFFVRLDEQEVFQRWTPSWLNLEIGENSWKSSKFHRKTTDKWNFIMFDKCPYLWEQEKASFKAVLEEID